MPPPSTAPQPLATLFGDHVRSGLTRSGQKMLPSKYFYDDVGSALFEAISLLPEYGLSRADLRLLQKHSEQVVRRLVSPVIVAELGSGAGKKVRWILEALAGRQSTCYYPIEISPAALAMCQRELREMDSVTVRGIEGEYLEGLRAAAGARQGNDRMLVLFLGSSIGNMQPPEAVVFLKKVRGLLMAGDALLLGTDLEKPVSQLIRAYDDACGVTRAFNLNLLARINRELDADFNLLHFEHRVRFNRLTHNVEMHLQSRCSETVAIPGAGISASFTEGETILTECSHKYSLSEVLAMSAEAGFSCEEQFVDHEWPFAENLLAAE
ncbi:MAG: L-histidine N(alpha)-methyltransferase [Terriglobia bacterium]